MKLKSFALAIAFLGMTSISYAQDFELLDTHSHPSVKLKKAVTEILDKEPEFAEFKKNLSGSIPGIEFATTDLNFDGKKEIVVRLLHEYFFRDKRNNVQIYVFAQTSKGLIKIFDAKAGDIALKGTGKHGLKNIAAFRGMTRKYDIYEWDGKARYVKR